MALSNFGLADPAELIFCRVANKKYQSLADNLQEWADKVLKYKLDHNNKPNEFQERTPQDKAAILEILVGLVNFNQDETREMYVRCRRSIEKIIQGAEDGKHRKDLIDELVRARLLQADTKTEADKEEPTVEIIHDTLLVNWSTLTEELKEKKEIGLIEANLKRTMMEHQKGGFQFITDERLLVGVQELLKYKRLEIWDDPKAEELVQKSLAMQKEKNELPIRLANEKATLASEKEKVAHSRSNIFRIALIIVFTLLVLSGLFGYFANDQRIAADKQRQEAEKQTQRAVSLQLAAQSRYLSDKKPDLALLLAVESTRLNNTAQTRATLVEQLEVFPRLETILDSQTLPGRVVFSPDGKLLVIGSPYTTAKSDRVVQLWDVVKRKPIDFPFGDLQGAFQGLAFSPDSKTLATAGSNNRILLWDILNRKSLDPFPDIHSDTINSLVFSPDGKYIASASNDRTIIIWDVASRKPTTTFHGHSDWVLSLAFSPNGEFLASGDKAGTIIIWSISQKSSITKMFGHNGGVTSLAIDPTGQFLASSGDNTPRIWRLNDTSNPLPLIGHTDIVSNVGFSPDGKNLITVSNDKTIRVWNVDSQTQTGPAITGHNQAITGLSVNPNSLEVATTSFDNTLRVWNISPTTSQGYVLPGQDKINVVTFSPDGRLLATGGEDKLIRIWDAKTRQPYGGPLQGHLYGVKYVNFSQDSKLLASIDRASIRVWDVAAGTQNINPINLGDITVKQVAFSPDGKFLLAVGEGEYYGLHVWKLSDTTQTEINITKSQAANLKGSTVIQDANLLAFSPDGKFFATTSSLGGSLNSNSNSNTDSVILWDAANFQPIGQILSDFASFQDLLFSNDGKTLITASDQIRVWDVKTQKQLDQYPNDSPITLMAKLSLSKDGKYLASIAGFKAILWDTVSHRILGYYPVTGSVSSYNALALSPDGATLAASNEKGILRLWNTDLETLQEKACAIANRDLSQAEWNDFIGSGFDYKPTCSTIIATAPLNPTPLPTDIAPTPSVKARVTATKPAANISPTAQSKPFTPPTKPINYIKWESSDKVFSVDIPDDWVNKGYGGNLEFYPKNARDFGYINIEYFAISQNTSSGLVELIVNEGLKKQFGNIFNQEETKVIAGTQVKGLIGTYQQQKVKFFIFVKGGYIWAFGLVVNTDLNSYYGSVFERFLSSFAIK